MNFMSKFTPKIFSRIGFRVGHHKTAGIPYFIDYSAHMSIVRTFILQFYLNTLFMNKVGECYLPSIVHRQHFQ
jgi:hypothetical protein